MCAEDFKHLGAVTSSYCWFYFPSISAIESAISWKIAGISVLSVEYTFGGFKIGVIVLLCCLLLSAPFSFYIFKQKQKTDSKFDA